MAVKKKIDRIVFFLNTTLTERDYNRFGVKIFKKDFDIKKYEFDDHLYRFQKNEDTSEYTRLFRKFYREKLGIVLSDVVGQE